MIPAPLDLLARELSALGRPSLFLEAEDDKPAVVLSLLRFDATRVAESIFLDDVIEALGGPRDESVALQIQIRLDLHTRLSARPDVVKLCNRLNRSLGRVGLYPHSESGVVLLRSLIPWTNRFLPGALVASVLDALDSLLEVAEPLLFAVAQERKTLADAEAELTRLGRPDSAMPLAPWQSTLPP